MITAVKFINESTLALAMDGVEYSVPDDYGNRHRRQIADEWEFGPYGEDGTRERINTIAPYVPPAVEPSLPYQNAIVAMLDAKAQERRYDGALSLSTYVGSTNAEWSAEASAFVAWRDSVWAYCYEQLALVAIQRRTQPTVAAFLTELPVMVWPVG